MGIFWTFGNLSDYFDFQVSQSILAAVVDCCDVGMYSMLSSIPYVLNPRHGLKRQVAFASLSNLFSCGICSWRTFADYMVKRWVKGRHASLIPKDHLRLAWFSLTVTTPSSMRTYEWAAHVGGEIVAAMGIKQIASSLQAVFRSSTSRRRTQAAWTLCPTER
jgi:hypothetical protein